MTFLESRNPDLSLQAKSDGSIRAFEFKWNEKKAAAKCPAQFRDAYPEADYRVITP